MVEEGQGLEADERIGERRKWGKRPGTEEGQGEG